MLESQLAAVLDGFRTTGQDIRTQNVTACVALANIVKSSFGPTGLDKMLVDSIGDVTITNDGATILGKLDVEHPAAKVLVQLADLQDKEVGDGTTSVVLIAAELLKMGNQLIQAKVPATTVISGFRTAMREACSFIKDNLTISTNDLNEKALKGIASTSMSSKIIGHETDFFSDLVVTALERVATTNSKGRTRYPVGAVKILKALGGRQKESIFVEGYSISCVVASDAMPKLVHQAKIALLDFDLSRTKIPHGMNVEGSAKDMSEIGDREISLLKERCGLIMASGANVILTCRGMDDIATKFFVENGVMGIRRVDKDDLKRIARATGGTIVLNLASDSGDGEEIFDPQFLGTADEVAQTPISDKEVIIIKGTQNSSTSSIILRGSTHNMLDEMERAVHDALCATKRVLESRQVVPGGGAVETALSVHLERFALTLGAKHQIAVAKFAEALMCIPKILAKNSAIDSGDIVAKLYTLHDSAQTMEDKRHYMRYGLDLANDTLRDCVEDGVLEPALGKVKLIKFATEAAITILRIDDLIKLNPKPEPEHPHDH